MPWIRLLPVLAQLRSVFPRKVTFFVFVTAVIGFMVRMNQRGATSLVRARKIVCYVGAIFPSGKRTVLMCTNTELSPEATIEAYSARMRIEQGFTVSSHNVGAYSYHVWTKAMNKIKRCSKGQFVHHEPEEVRSKMFETHGAYELYVACGLIAQGLLRYLAVAFPAEVTALHGKWYRSRLATVSPTEEIVQDALRHALPRLRRADQGLETYPKFLESKTSDPGWIDAEVINSAPGRRFPLRNESRVRPGLGRFAAPGRGRTRDS